MDPHLRADPISGCRPNTGLQRLLLPVHGDEWASPSRRPLHVSHPPLLPRSTQLTTIFPCQAFGHPKIDHLTVRIVIRKINSLWVTRYNFHGLPGAWRYRHPKVMSTLTEVLKSSKEPTSKHYFRSGYFDRYNHLNGIVLYHVWSLTLSWDYLLLNIAVWMCQAPNNKPMYYHPMNLRT